MSKLDDLKRKNKGRFVVAANAFIFKGDEILVTKRNDDRDHDPDKWECVSGRFNQHFATVEDEVVREISEELGKYFRFRLIAPISFYHFYRADIKDDELVGINYIGEYLGGDITLTEEHVDYKWIKPEKFIEQDIHKLLIKDIKHLIKVKDIYLNNKDVFLHNFKKSN